MAYVINSESFISETSCIDNNELPQLSGYNTIR